MRLLFVNTTPQPYTVSLPTSQQPQERLMPANQVTAVDFQPEAEFNLIFGPQGAGNPCDLGLTFTGQETGTCMIVAREGEDCTVHTTIPDTAEMPALP